MEHVADNPMTDVTKASSAQECPDPLKIPEKTRLERITLEPIPSVGLLGLDKGSWHCGGGMGGL